VVVVLGRERLEPSTMSVNAMFEGCGRDNKTERDFEKCDIEAKSAQHHIHITYMVMTCCRPTGQLNVGRVMFPLAAGTVSPGAMNQGVSNIAIRSFHAQRFVQNQVFFIYLFDETSL